MMQTGNDESLAFYPIRTLSALTGVNARTIRAWERRYELLTPFRTDSGHRLYTDEHVKTIKEVVRLLEQGVPISRVKPLLNQPAALKIHGEESRLMKHESEWPAFRETLVAATLKRDLHGMEKTCREVLERYPFDVVLRYLLIPTRNELLTQHSAEYYSLFDFILAEKLLHKIVSNFPADAIAKILVASNRPSAVGVEFLSFCWALASQKMMP
ncbi:MAG TPA: MerR family transcriptional regulator, partial [Pseudomonadales bacterium]|nr:MerR family transcriptional regulator [Pseudomonadales bacterium]